MIPRRVNTDRTRTLFVTIRSQIGAKRGKRRERQHTKINGFTRQGKTSQKAKKAQRTSLIQPTNHTHGEVHISTHA